MARGEGELALRGHDAGGTTRALPPHLKYATLQPIVMEEEKKTPSQLAAELRGDSAQPLALLRPRIVELLNLSEFSQHTTSVVPLDEPLFQPSPPAVVFDAFEAHAVYKVELRLRNNDAVARRVKVLAPQSAVFAVERLPTAAGAAANKVAPGMEACFVVRFAPVEPLDYSCDLLVVTEREKFVVPLRARGPRALLDFPDAIAFGTHPVKSGASEAVLVRNTGRRASRVTLSAPPPFSVSPAHALLAVDEAVQFEFGFAPESCGEARRELRIEYETGEVCFGMLSGCGADVDVRLEASVVHCAHTYISLRSQKTVRVLNRSAAPVSFAFKLYADARDERDDKLERLLQLEAVDASGGALSPRLSSSLASALGVGGGARPLDGPALVALRQAVEEDALLFADPVFALEPASGVIYPGCHVEVTVTFVPERAGHWRSVAYLEVTGREARAPLELAGVGLGPQAEFLFDTLEVGDVFVNSVHRYELELENVGNIDLRFALLPSDATAGGRFVFAPETAAVEVGGAQRIGLTYTSGALGEFSETFAFLLDGQPAPLTVTVKGRVVGPTFTLEPQLALNFGHVSFGMRNERTLVLHNTSEIPMRYALRIPDETAGAARAAHAHHLSGAPDDFVISPNRGVLLPRSQQQVDVSFTSHEARAYNTALVVDIESVGEALLSCPLFASCVIPQLVASRALLDFESADIRHEYTQRFTLRNESSILPAQFEAVPYAPASRTLAHVAVTPERGVLPPSGEVEITVAFAAQRLGRLELPLRLRIVGTDGEMGVAALLLRAVAVGPALELSLPVVDFGKVPVLTHRSLPLVLTNRSLIAAHVTTAVRKPNSNFSCEPKSATIPPGGSATLTVGAHLDEAIRFADELYLALADSDELMVPLAAVGTGSTIWCAEPLDRLDFGQQLTATVLAKELVLENRGRKPVMLTFVNATAEEARKGKGATRKGVGAGASTGAVASVEAVFKVVPESLTIEAKSEAVVSFRALSASRVGLVEERFACAAKAAVGKEKPLFELVAACEFATPLIEASPSELRFEYLYEPTVPIGTSSQTLALRNVTQLPLTLSLRVKAPFSLDRTELALPAGADAQVVVTWDPAHKGDRQSEAAETKITIAYREHPQRDAVRLLSDAQFPNVAFDLKDPANLRVDFGACLNETAKKVVALMTNTSRVDVAYAWFHEQAAAEAEPRPPSQGPPLRQMPPRSPSTQDAGQLLAVADPSRPVGRAMSVRSTANRRPPPPAPLVQSAELFDVLPLRGVLRPGQSERLEFSYAGLLNRRARCNVVCVVEGGPEYAVALSAESAVVQYALERSQLECGVVPMDKVLEQEVVLHNPGKVALAWSVRKHALGRPSLLECLPASGRVRAGESAKITVLYLPAMPGRLRETFHLQVNHLEPAPITLVAEATYPRLATSLPRVESDESRRWLREAIREWADEHDETPPAAVLALATQGSSGALGQLADALASRGDGRSVARTSRAQNAKAYEREVIETIYADAERLGLRAVLSRMLDEATAAVAAGTAVAEGSPDAADGAADELGGGGLPPSRSGGARGRPASSGGGALVAAAAAAPTLPGLIKRLQSCFPSLLGADVAAATYVCDFGNVIKGTARKKTFKLKNVGYFALSFELEKGPLAAAGFSLEPNKVVKLPGFPEHESVDFAVTFSAAKNRESGVVRHRVLVDVKSGAPVALVFRAHVTVPELTVSREAIDFGLVLVGEQRQVTVQLHNRGVVAADWALKPPLEGADDWAFFTAEPAADRLEPRAKQNVLLKFAPTGSRAYALKLAFKLANNPKPVVVALRGQGRALKLECAPHVLALPPVTPHSAGSVVEFALTNPNDVAIEVYCVQLDKDYLREEALLRDAVGYDADDRLALPPRAAGEPFWPHLVAEANERAARAAAEAAAAAPAAADDDGAAVGELTDGALAAAPPRACADLVVALFGPPLADAAAVAAALAARYGCPLVDLDTLVVEAAARGDELAAALIAALPQLAPPSAVAELPPAEPLDGAEPTPTPTPTAPAAASSRPPTAAGAPPAAAAAAAAKKGAAAAAASAVTAPPVPPPPAEPAPLDRALLGRVVAAALGRAPLAGAAVVVVSGLGCAYADGDKPAEVAAALYEGVGAALRADGLADGPAALEDSRRLRCLEVSITLAELQTRLAADLAAALEALPSLAQFVEIDEAAYDALAPADVAAYELERGAHRAVVRAREAERGAAQAAAARTLDEQSRAWSKYMRAAADVRKGLKGELPTADEAAAAAPPKGKGAVPKAKEPKEAAKPKKGEAPAPTPPPADDEPAPYATVFPLEAVTPAEGEGAAAPAAAPAAAGDDDGTPAEPAEPAAPPPPPPTAQAVRAADATAAAELATRLGATYLPELRAVHEEPILEIPQPRTRQLVRRPRARGAQRPVARFWIENAPVDGAPAADEPAAAAVVEAAAPPAKGVKGAAVVEPVAPPAAPPPPPRPTRWLLGPRESVRIEMHFASTRLGTFAQSLTFEVTGLANGIVAPVGLSASGVCALPSISNEPRNVFGRKIKAKPPLAVRRQWVAARSAFEWGPLLVGVAADKAAGYAAANAELFHISNNSLFDAAVDFSFVHLGVGRFAPTPPTAAADGGHDGGVKSKFAVAEATGATIFSVEPRELLLAAGETADVRVSASPDVLGSYADTLVCAVRGNPTPVTFELGAIGATPRVALSAVELEFERLMLGRAESLRTTLSSHSPLPVAWAISAADIARLARAADEATGAAAGGGKGGGKEAAKDPKAAAAAAKKPASSPTPDADAEPAAEPAGGPSGAPADFVVYPTAGVLEPFGAVELTVTFRARVSSKPRAAFAIDVQDTLGLCALVQTISVSLVAEAYSVDVQPVFGGVAEDGGGAAAAAGAGKEAKGAKGAAPPTAATPLAAAVYDGLDFGLCRVVDERRAAFEIVNSGKYDVGYEVRYRRRAVEAVVSIAQTAPPPVPGAPLVIPAGGRATLTGVFKSAHETHFDGEPDVRVHFSEPLTGEALSALTLPIKLRARSVFSKYALIPSRGVSFGPLFVRTERSRSFELANAGEFEFTYTLARAPAQLVETLPARSAGGGPAATPRATEAKVVGDALVVGPFSISPYTGKIAAGSTQVVTVRFAAPAEALSFCEPVVVSVSEREPSDSPHGYVYELSGESCIPGINTAGFHEIFEEQAVVRELELGGDAPPKNLFATEARLFSFGAALVGTEVAERIRISNPIKVTARVAIAIRPHGAPPSAIPISAAADGAGGDKKGGKAKPPDAAKGAAVDAAVRVPSFDVEPKSLLIPPHEHRYVTVFFNPVAMQAFRGQFEAVVEDGTERATNRLSFDVLGEGTLPHVTVVEPAERSEAGLATLRFPRTLVGKRAVRRVSVRNDGILASHVRIELPAGARGFSMSPPVAQFTVVPKATQSVEVTFAPVDDADAAVSLSVSVLGNQFEEQLVACVGTAYVASVALEDLPEPEREGLWFGDVPVGASRELAFTLTNFGKEARRFEWQPVEGRVVAFSPAAGQLRAGASKRIVATFRSDAPFRTNALGAACALRKILQVSGPSDWDSSLSTVRYVTDDEWRHAEELRALAAAAAEAGAPAADAPAPPAWRLADERPAGGRGGRDEGPRKVIEQTAEPPYTYVDALAGGATPPSGSTPRPKTPPDGKGKPTADAKPAKPAKGGKADEPAPVDAGVELVPLRISACCDHAKFACGATALSFKPTAMFQTRSHAFELRNTGEVALDFGWTVSAVGGGPPSLRPTQESDVYAVSPARGSLGPGAVATITVSFSPVEVEDYGRELRCAIANLPAGVEAPRLPLSGRATRPFCHFELAESDYLSAGRRPAAHGAVVSPDAKVIEFESLGVRVRNTKRFYMVNPTSISYEFEWAPDAGGGADVQSVKQSPFALHTRKGQITGGKRVEMVIDFTPEALEPVEEHWRFRIRAAGIDMPVLLVGAMREPKLTFDRTRHNFGPLLLGQRAQETVSLRNDELIPFAFAFDPKSYSSAATGDGQVIAIEPESGVVPAHGSAQLVVTFTPSAEKDFNFNLLCEVKKKATPLTLNIKGEGAAIHDAISLVEGERTLQLAAGAGQRNPCAFGSVHMNQKVVAALTVENKGRFNFDVEWSLQMPGGAVVPAAITLTPPYATAKRGSKTVFELAYKPVRAGPLPPGLVAVGQVSNGRRYELQVTGEGSMPRVSFSWLQHDFGPTFVHARGMPVETKLLRVANDDTVEHFVNVLWDSGAAVVAAAGRRPATPGGGAGADDGEADETAFEMEAAPAVLQPGEAREILVAFKPRSTRAYAVTVPIEINQLYRVGVDLRGEGCECRAELASAAMQQVQFGTVRSGAEVRRTVTLVNRSRRALELDLTAAADELAGSEITILLAKATQPGVARVALRPREAVEIALTFKPTRRAPAFSHELVARLSSRPRPLLMLLGSCEAMEVRLETEAVPFGPVVLHAAATRRLQLENQGDIGTRFDWDAAAFAPHFTIAPLSGFIGPGEDVTFELAFRPVAVSRDLYARPTLRIDGGRALPLSLTGQCVEATAQDKPLAFRARVRERASLSVPLKNSAQSAWRIKPILSSDTWEGDETIELAAGESKPYVVHYVPLTMSKEGSPHTGQLFLPMPDGSAQLYSLEGIADPPASAGTINVDVGARVRKPILLPVTNWLNSTQRFAVAVVRKDNAQDGATLEGHDHFDVPALQTREYRLNFYAHREGTSSAEVTFTNERTAEYVSYALVVKATPPALASTIALDGAVRALVSHALDVDNPLGAPVTFAVACDLAEVAVPSSLLVGAQGSALLELGWRPLVKGRKEGTLTLSAPELGVFVHKLLLDSIPAADARTLHFKAGLGGSQLQSFRFTNFVRGSAPTTYKCAVASGGDFELEVKEIAAPPADGTNGSEVFIDIKFEPSRLGECRDTLTVTHPEGGEYTCNLVGTGSVPGRAGPIVIKANASVQVPFKNVLASQVEFVATCTPANLFTVAKPRETIPAKKGSAITVAYKPDPTKPAGAPVQGQLTLVANAPESATGSEAPLRWVFYLRGE